MFTEQGSSVEELTPQSFYSIGSNPAPARKSRAGKKKKRPKKAKGNKPKKAMTPFMVFSKETRKLLVAENPNLTFSEIGRELGHRWRNLPLPDRQIFIEKAQEDYQRFLKESEKIEALNPTRKRKTVEQKKQTKMKKSISAYLYFCNAHREQFKATHPDMKMVEIQRLLADKWMNAPPAVKLPFEKQAEADREKYNSDIVNFSNPVSLERTSSEPAMKVETYGDYADLKVEPAFFQGNGYNSVDLVSVSDFVSFPKRESVENFQNLFNFEGIKSEPMDLEFSMDVS